MCCTVTKHRCRSSGKNTRINAICGYSEAVNVRRSRLSSSTISLPERENALQDSLTVIRDTSYQTVMLVITVPEKMEPDVAAGFMHDENS